MAKQAGRLVKLYKGTGVGAVLVAGGRTDTVSINNEPIDITDKAAEGWRTLLDVASVRSVDLSFAGLMDGATLASLSLGTESALLADYEIRIEDIGTVAGSFWFASAEIGAPHDDAVEISCEFQSSGVVTWANT